MTSAASIILVLQLILTRLSYGGCNYISFGTYGIPANTINDDMDVICVRGSQSIVTNVASFPTSQYICDPNKPNIITFKRYFCSWDALNPYFNTCRPRNSGSTGYQCSWLSYSNANDILKEQFDYNTTNTDTSVTINCNDENNSNDTYCDYVVTYYYISPNPQTPGSPMTWDSIYRPYVINECINKQIYGCNDTNVWIIDYHDVECKKIKSIQFPEIRKSGYPRFHVMYFFAII